LRSHPAATAAEQKVSPGRYNIMEAGCDGGGVRGDITGEGGDVWWR